MINRLFCRKTRLPLTDSNIVSCWYRCAGITALQMTATTVECKFIYGDPTLGVFTRTMLRTGLTKLQPIDEQNVLRFA